jgi:hypothetical protein
VFSPGLGGWFKPMGRDKTLGLNSSTLLPYERGASASGFGSDEAAAPGAVLSEVSEAVLSDSLFGLGFRRRGWLVTKVLHGHNRHASGDLMDAPQLGRANAPLSIVRCAQPFTESWPGTGCGVEVGRSE